MLSSLNGLSQLLASSLLAASFAAPVEWSPNGRWLAYTITDASSTSLLAEGWLTSAPAAASPSIPAGGLIHRVWVARLGEAPESVLIEQSRRPLSSPSWSPDGRSLVYARFVPASTDADPAVARGRYDAVIQSGLDQKKEVVVDSELALDADDLAGIIHLKPVISPDARYLAVPLPGKSSAIAIVRLDTGAVVKTLEGAKSPSWAPDGLRLLFMRESRAADGRVVWAPYVLNRDLGSARQITSDRPLLDAPPAWALDGQSIFVLAQPPPALARNVPLQIDLCSLSLGTAAARPVVTLESLGRTLQPNPIVGGRMRGGGRPAAPPPVVAGAAFTIDHDQNECVALIEIGGQPQALRWCNIRNQRMAKLINPLDLQIRIGAPAIAPDGRSVAFRAEAPGMLGLPAVCDLSTEAVTLIAPDEATRRVWLELLASRAVEILKSWMELRVGRGASDLATILPSPLELVGVEPAQHRLRRLARFADDLIDQPSPADAPEPAAPQELEARDQIRLFFDYLRGDFQAAELRLNAVEARTADRGSRLRWLGLRAQILLGQGELDRARGISAYISRVARVGSFEVEETPAGPVVTTVANPDAEWAARLASSLAPGAPSAAGRRIGLDPADGGAMEPNPAELDPFNEVPVDAPRRFPFLRNTPDAGIGGLDSNPFGGRMLVEPPAPRFLPDPGLAPPPPQDGLIPPRL